MWNEALSFSRLLKKSSRERLFNRARLQCLRENFVVPGGLWFLPTLPRTPLRSILGYHGTRLRRFGFSGLVLHGVGES